MVELSDQDLLTGLLHAGAFTRRAGEALGRAALAGQPYVVIVVEAPLVGGDAVLVDTARRVRDVVRSRDLVARTGVNELAVCCPTASEAEGRSVARRLAEAVGQPYELDGRFVVLAMGIGLFAREVAQPGDSVGFALLAARAAIERSDY